MIIISGEVRKIIPSEYVKKSSGVVEQKATLIIEPSDGRRNYEINISAKQISSGALDAWSQLKGQQASEPVSLYVNHDFKFYRFSAIGNGLPTTRG